MKKLLGYLAVASLVTGLYLAFMFVPIYIDNLDAKDIMNTCFNQYRDMRSPEVLSETLLRQYNSVDWATHVEEDEFGEKKVVNGLGLTSDDLFIEFDERTKILTLRITYSRIVQLKPTEKLRKVTFVLDRVGKPPNIY
jgi:hypothetical protein